jgi:hypothetical protein
VEAGNLAIAVPVLPEATDEAFHNKTGMIDLPTWMDEIDVRSDPRHVAPQAEDGALFLLG